jgi:hypothetical protein
MQSLDPRAFSEQKLGRGQVPGLRGDAAELKLDTVIQPAAAGVRQLAPGAQGEDEVLELVTDEVVAGDAILYLLRAADDQEILWLV